MSALHVPLIKVECLRRISRHTKLNVTDVTLGVLYEEVTLESEKVNF